MSLLFLDSFDDRQGNYGRKYDLSAFTAGMGGTTGRTGNGVQWVGLAGQSFTKVFAARPTYVIGMALSFDNGSNDARFLEVLDGSTVQLYLQVNATTKTVSVRRGGDDAVLATSQTNLSASLFVYLELKATVDGASGSVELRFNGVTDGKASGINTRNAASPNNSATGIRCFAETNGTFWVLDDLYIADNQGSANNDFLGALKIECLRPAAAGTGTGWTPNGVAANFQCVADADPDDDATYISASTPGLIDTYSFADLSSALVTVKGVQFAARGREDDVAVRTVAPVVRHAGTNYAGGALALGSSYADSQQLYETNPGTGAAWLAGDVNAAEFGIELVS